VFCRLLGREVNHSFEQVVSETVGSLERLEQLSDLGDHAEAFIKDLYKILDGNPMNICHKIVWTACGGDSGFAWARMKDQLESGGFTVTGVEVTDTHMKIKTFDGVVRGEIESPRSGFGGWVAVDGNKPYAIGKNRLSALTTEDVKTIREWIENPSLTTTPYGQEKLSKLLGTDQELWTIRQQTSEHQLETAEIQFKLSNQPQEFDRLLSEVNPSLRQDRLFDREEPLINMFDKPRVLRHKLPEFLDVRPLDPQHRLDKRFFWLAAQIVFQNEERFPALSILVSQLTLAVPEEEELDRDTLLINAELAENRALEFLSWALPAKVIEMKLNPKNVPARIETVTLNIPRESSKKWRRFLGIKGADRIEEHQILFKSSEEQLRLRIDPLASEIERLNRRILLTEEIREPIRRDLCGVGYDAMMAGRSEFQWPFYEPRINRTYIWMPEECITMLTSSGQVGIEYSLGARLSFATKVTMTDNLVQKLSSLIDADLTGVTLDTMEDAFDSIVDTSSLAKLDFGTGFYGINRMTRMQTSASKKLRAAVDILGPLNRLSWHVLRHKPVFGYSVKGFNFRGLGSGSKRILKFKAQMHPLTEMHISGGASEHSAALRLAQIFAGDARERSYSHRVLTYHWTVTNFLGVPQGELHSRDRFNPLIGKVSGLEQILDEIFASGNDEVTATL
jgi:hypothetical protein